MKKFITILMLICVISTSLAATTLYTPNGKAFQTIDANHPAYTADDYASWAANELGPGNLYPNSHVVGSWENIFRN